MSFKRKFGAIMTLAVMALNTTSAFAAAPYGMEYSGGEALGANNLTVDPELINGLTALSDSTRYTYHSSNSNKQWVDGYWMNDYGNCVAWKFLKVKVGDPINSSDGVYWTVEGKDYSAVVRVKNTVIVDDPNNISGADNYYTLSPAMSAGYQVYLDSNCENLDTNSMDLVASQESRVFAEVNVKLYKKGASTATTADEMYLAITDIDASQSYKILNPDNLLTKERMFVTSLAAVQPESGTGKNMFVANGNYIYAKEQFNIPTGKSNIYVKLDFWAQQNGVDIVFGFGNKAGSGIIYFAKQYKVIYQSDSNGEVTGIKNEDVLSGNNPTGTTERPNNNYKTTHWTADVDVTLDDGSTITAGEKLTLEQIKRVVVHQDITFTVFHATAPGETPPAEVPKVPNTGVGSIMKINAIATATITTAILAVALVAKISPRIFRKRVKFEKRK